MPDTTTPRADSASERRELQTQIARLRRRIDRRVSRARERVRFIGTLKEAVTGRTAHTLLFALTTGKFLYDLFRFRKRSGDAAWGLWGTIIRSVWSLLGRFVNRSVVAESEESTDG